MFGESSPYWTPEAFELLLSTTIEEELRVLIVIRWKDQIDWKK